MSLTRAWMRDLLGASAGSALAPVALLGVVAVLALGGGLGGLSTLAQLVSGPAADARAGGVRAAALRPSAHGPSASATLLAALLAGTGTGTGPAAAGSGAGGGRTSARGAPTPKNGSLPTVPTPAAPGRPNTPPQGGSSSPAPTGPATPPPTVVDQVGQRADAVAAALPAPVSAVAQSAVNTVTSTVDTLLPPPLKTFPVLPRSGASVPAPQVQPPPVAGISGG